MELSTWVRQNRRLIDGRYIAVVRDCPADDEEREVFVMNDEPLYNEALAAGAITED